MSAPPPALSGASETLETLGLPPGAVDAQSEPASSPTEPPRTPLDARVYCTLLARDLGRTLRELHGTEPRCDVDGLEIAQRYLREAVPDAGLRTLRPDEQRLVTRHGALLSELLARQPGGTVGGPRGRRPAALGDAGPLAFAIRAHPGVALRARDALRSNGTQGARPRELLSRDRIARPLTPQQ